MPTDEQRHPEVYKVEVRDYIVIKGTSAGEHGDKLKTFQIKRMSSAPWFCLQEVRAK
jgi:hypothetical protein